MSSLSCVRATAWVPQGRVRLAIASLARLSKPGNSWVDLGPRRLKVRQVRRLDRHVISKTDVARRLRVQRTSVRGILPKLTPNQIAQAGLTLMNQDCHGRLEGRVRCAHLPRVPAIRATWVTLRRSRYDAASVLRYKKGSTPGVRWITRGIDVGHCAIGPVSTIVINVQHAAGIRRL